VSAQGLELAHLGPARPRADALPPSCRRLKPRCGYSAVLLCDSSSNSSLQLLQYWRTYSRCTNHVKVYRLLQDLLKGSRNHRWLQRSWMQPDALIYCNLCIYESYTWAHCAARACSRQSVPNEGTGIWRETSSNRIRRRKRASLGRFNKSCSLG
jgi:hypothetical protein